MNPRDRDEDINWWAQQDSDEQWIEEQMRRYEQEQWEAEQDARKWAAVPEEQDLRVVVGFVLRG